jgi:hypothetical protein
MRSRRRDLASYITHSTSLLLPLPIIDIIYRYDACHWSLDMILMSPDPLSSTGWSPYRGSLPVPNIPCPVLSTSSGLIFETLEEVIPIHIKCVVV